MKNGYRNILATIGITQDGKMRNIIGQEAERAVREKLSEWIVQAGIPCERQERWFVLGAAKTVRMAYGSEPDICFEPSSARSQTGQAAANPQKCNKNGAAV